MKVNIPVNDRKSGTQYATKEPAQPVKVVRILNAARAS
jgi:hypothetical protein